MHHKTYSAGRISKLLYYRSSFIDNGEGVNAEGCVYRKISSTSFQSRHFSCVCRPGFIETRLGNSPQGVCYLTVTVTLYGRYCCPYCDCSQYFGFFCTSILLELRVFGVLVLRVLPILAVVWRILPVLAIIWGYV